MCSSDLRRPSASSAQADLVAWGPYPTVREQLDTVLHRKIFIDWEALGRLSAPLSDDRPLNEYFLVRRLARRNVRAR